MPPIKKLFLIDCLGALLSAFILGFVLVRFETIFGMPENILYLLSIIAITFSVYSLLCYIFLKENEKPYLKIIALANVLYCFFTLALVMYLHKELSNWGFIYFVSEVGVILTLAIIEWKATSK